MVVVAAGPFHGARSGPALDGGHQPRPAGEPADRAVVEYRSSSNSLPEHMQVSLQAAVQNFSSGERDAVLSTKLRDLQMAQFRLTQPYAMLAGGYAQALADFLGEDTPQHQAHPR